MDRTTYIACFICVLGVSVLAVACQSTKIPSETNDEYYENSAPFSTRSISPQAQPIFAWLHAVKISDVEQFKLVFSERMKRKFKKYRWSDLLEDYQIVFKHDFGNYEMEDFTFEFNGDKDKGEVIVFHNGVKYGGLRVVKEKESWKVDER